MSDEPPNERSQSIRALALMKNTMVLGLGTFLPKVASFVILPILTGCLTKTEYGIYDLVITMVSLLLPAVTLQIQTAAFRFLIEVRNDIRGQRSVITNSFAFVLPISFLTLIILFFALGDMDTIVKVFICFYFLADVLANEARQCVRGLGMNAKYSASAFISALAQMILAILLVLVLGLGLLGASILLFSAEALAFVYLVFAAKLYTYFDQKVLRFSLVKKMLAYAWPMVPNSMSMWVMNLSNRIVITLFMGVAANASYAVASKIPQIVTLAQSTFTMAWQENASLAVKEEDSSEYYSKMFDIVFRFVSGFTALLIAATPALFPLLVKGGYDDAYFQIPALIFGMLFSSMAAYLGGIYVAYMKTKSVGLTTIVAALINLGIDIIGVPVFGLSAASAAIVVSYVFLCVYRMIDVRKFSYLSYSISIMCVTCLVIIIQCALCILQLPLFNVVNAIIGILLFSILNYSALSKICRALIIKMNTKN